MFLKDSFIFTLIAVQLNGLVQCQTENHFFRKDYQYIEETQSFYKVHKIGRPWLEARKMCLWEGASLYYPRDDIEERLIDSKLLNDGDGSYYIGISSLIIKGIFETVDGLLISDVYNEWFPGEPNNTDGNEDCVIMHRDGTLNDIPCEVDFMFICKKPLETLHWNELCNLPDNGYVYNGEGKCYKIHLKPRTWSEAHGYCRAEQSFLAVVNTKAEAEILTNIIEKNVKPKDKDKLNASIHLGFHNRYGDGWETITGVDLEDTGYAIWADEDVEENEQEACGSMLFNGQLKDVNCDAKRIYICEHDIDNYFNKTNFYTSITSTISSDSTSSDMDTSSDYTNSASESTTEVIPNFTLDEGRVYSAYFDK